MKYIICCGWTGMNYEVKWMPCKFTKIPNKIDQQNVQVLPQLVRRTYRITTVVVLHDHSTISHAIYRKSSSRNQESAKCDADTIGPKALEDWVFKENQGADSQRWIWNSIWKTIALSSYWTKATASEMDSVPPLLSALGGLNIHPGYPCPVVNQRLVGEGWKLAGFSNEGNWPTMIPWSFRWKVNHKSVTTNKFQRY